MSTKRIDLVLPAAGSVTATQPTIKETNGE